MDEKEFLKKFEDLSLPANQFNHVEHLWLGWLYVRDNRLGIACDKLNTGIKRFAESLGATGKFHFTLTTTFACVIKSRFNSRETFNEFLCANQDLLNDAIKIIETHYSKDLLSTEEARTRLVRPDKKPFPEEYEREIGL